MALTNFSHLTHFTLLEATPSELLLLKLPLGGALGVIFMFAFLKFVKTVALWLFHSHFLVSARCNERAY